MKMKIFHQKNLGTKIQWAVLKIKFKTNSLKQQSEDKINKAIKFQLSRDIRKL